MRSASYVGAINKATLQFVHEKTPIHKLFIPGNHKSTRPTINLLFKMLYMWVKRSYPKSVSISIQRIPTARFTTLPKKRQWSASWTGPRRSNIKYPVYLSAEIHTVNFYNTNPLLVPGIIAGITITLSSKGSFSTTKFMSSIGRQITIIREIYTVTSNYYLALNSHPHRLRCSTIMAYMHYW